MKGPLFFLLFASLLCILFYVRLVPYIYIIAPHNYRTTIIGVCAACFALISSSFCIYFLLVFFFLFFILHYSEIHLIYKFNTIAMHTLPHTLIFCMDSYRVLCCAVYNGDFVIAAVAVADSVVECQSPGK